jgi:hypothetical protein
MKTRSFKFWFKGGPIIVWAFNEEDAEILAKAEAIKKGWDSTIIPKPNIEKLNLTINWNQLDSDEALELHRLLCKANYEKEGE